MITVVIPVGPREADKEFYAKVGPFDEGVDAYDTEREYSIPVASRNDLKLACLVDLHGPWEHIGKYEVGRLRPW